MDEGSPIDLKTELALEHALDKALNGDGSHECLHCGRKWKGRVWNPHPKNCPTCHSVYWDRPPLSKKCRKPDQEFIKKKLEKNSEDMQRKRAIKKLEREAAKFGYRVEREQKITVKHSLLSETPDLSALAEKLRSRAYGPTVPPPPGMED